MGVTTDFKLFPYLIKDVVAEVRAVYDGIEGKRPYYEFGTYLELTKAVETKNIIDAEKYPLIWLVWEANESLQKFASKVSYTVSPRLFICNFTDADYSSIERYDANFIGVLFPIFEIFKKYLEYNKFITSSTIFDYTKADHLYWGESLNFQKKQNILTDTLDAIEIKFNSLEINKIC